MSGPGSSLRRLGALLVVGLAAWMGSPWTGALAQAPNPLDAAFDSVSFESLDPGGLVGVKDRGLFHGRIVVSGTGSGLTLLNELALEDYLRGIAEVPSSWPLEAQKAQVIAARSYLLAERSAGSYSSYGADICATDACQVYQGADREPTTPLWQEAVGDTGGQVLLYQGSPILARYHSSDGGHTKSNLEVYGNAVPYLQGVPDPDDAVSPLHHWVVRFPLADLEASLRSLGSTSPPPGRLADASRPGDGPLVVTTEEPGGARHSEPLDPVKVMIRLNNDAPGRFPGRYPGSTESGNGQLPSTIPHEDYTVKTGGGVAVFDGGGWGHKVGMSQYGAKGKAERGMAASEILAAYYSGLTPAPYPEPPTVRVLLGYGLDTRTIASNGPFRILDGTGRTIVASTLGGWQVRSEGGQVKLTAPAGIDAPLSVGPAVPVGLPFIQSVPGAIRFSLTSPARIEATLEGPQGTRRLPVRVLDAGERELLIGDLFNKVLPKPGRYKLHVVATDTRGSKVETVAEFQIEANARADIPTSDALFGVPVAAGAQALGPATARPAPGGRGAPAHFPTAYLAAVLVLAAVGVAVWRARVWLDRWELVGAPDPMPAARPEPWLDTDGQAPPGATPPAASAAPSEDDAPDYPDRTLEPAGPASASGVRQPSPSGDSSGTTAPPRPRLRERPRLSSE